MANNIMKRQNGPTVNISELEPAEAKKAIQKIIKHLQGK